MNMEITEGVVLRPTPFAEGLDVWSREDGTAGSASYEGASDAALVPGDPDFAGALEMVKTQSVQKLRYKARTPVVPGTYLRVRARVKAVSGNLPKVRIAGWAGRGDDRHVGGLDEAATEVQLTDYGAVVEVSAIVGAGRRGGVDLSWGTAPEYGYFGLDLTGPTGGVVRIDDIVIEDVTGAFVTDMLPIVDVRDYGARGDGTTDDAAAFNAADADSDGREIIVPAGTYFLGDDVTIDTRIRFEGTVVQPAAKVLLLRKNFDLPTYIDAFGDEQAAFRKAVQALVSNADHDSLDMCGRRVEVTSPIDMADVARLDVFEVRRVIRNGQFNVRPSAAWDTAEVTSAAAYNPANPTRLSNVANVANIEVGSHVSGAGVGREVYVRARNVGAKTIELSQPLHGGAGSRAYTFRRYRYVLDFFGFSKLSKFQISDVEFLLDGRASGILLADDGVQFHVRDCVFNKPKDRGITSVGRACQGMQIDRCLFLSKETAVAAPLRTTVAMNTNANDPKIRDSRFQQFGTSMVLHGSGNMLVANHWFQGDNVPNGARVAGVVFTNTNLKTIITGNYIDNSWVEWANECDANPNRGNEFSFGGLTVTGNIFTANDVANWFNWIVIKPYGTGHFVSGLNVSCNTFKSLNGTVGRVDKVDASIAPLDMSRARLVTFAGNAFNGIDQETVNPVTLEFSQPTAAATWTLGPGPWLPFDGWSRTVPSVAAQGVIRNGANAAVYAMPSVQPLLGAGTDQVRLGWPEPVKGTVQLTVRMDRPY